MARAIWKVAIGFGLVHIPVSRVPAIELQGIDFDWPDSRGMARWATSALIRPSAKAGKIEDVENGERKPASKSADVIDLTDLLNRSLEGNSSKPARKRSAK